MDSLRKALASIQSQLGKLNSTQKLLIASIVVVLGMALFIMSQYAGKQVLAEVLPGAAAADIQRAKTHLDTVGIAYKPVDGKLMVAVEDAGRAKAALAESQNLPGDKALFFESLVAKQSWTASRQQNDQAFTVALQNELAGMISGFRGVKSAKVIIDVPEVRGLGVAVRKPTAAATVMTQSGSALSQSQVDAIAGLIAGSRAGLELERVRVIDAATGRQRKAQSDEDSTPSTYLEYAGKLETQTREKVLEMLSYIPGVVVAVTAQVDVTRSSSRIESNLAEKQGSVAFVRKTVENQRNSSEGSAGSGEAGVGANQTADINKGASTAAGNKEGSTETTTEYENHVGNRVETIVDPKGHATSIAVSVNVPRGFVANLLKSAQPQQAGGGGGAAATQGPTEQEIAQRFDAEIKPQIMASLTPHIRAMIAKTATGLADEEIKKLVDASIGVAMIPVDTIPTVSIAGGVGGGGSGVVGVLGLPSGLLEKGVLGVLSIVALGMMAMMVKKVGKKAEMPNAEELVGLPPQLDAQSDVIGEADESDTALAGIEVGDDEMQAQKMLEQVGDLVQSSPESAARLLSRWIDVDE